MIKNAKHKQNISATQDDVPAENSEKPKPKDKKKISKGTIWAIKITIITFILACCITFITEIASTRSNVIISILLLLFLIVIAILFDAMGVAAASCDPAPLHSMASRKVKGANYAVKLVKNAEKVSNICNDVIGDMAGIISGICTATIVMKVATANDMSTEHALIFSILMSSVVSAVTVGGKAFFKTIALKNAKEMMLLAGKFVSVFARKNKQAKK